MKKRGYKLSNEIGRFLQQYARKKRPGQSEPNDREYSRRVEKLVKRLPPEELERLLNEE